MNGHRRQVTWGRHMLLAGLLPLLLLGCSTVPLAAHAQERAPRDQAPASVRLESLATGYTRAGSLGFALRDTALDEQLFRRVQGAERGALWSARFVSRWTLTDDQLDRWSAQVIGLLVDEIGADIHLGGWERLPAGDIGDRRVAYRYALVTSSGTAVGEATVVVFARGDEVGLTGTAAVGTRAPIDGIFLARMLDTQGGRG